MASLRLFYGALRSLHPIFTRSNLGLHHLVLMGRSRVDIAFVVAIAAFWGVLVLLVRGFRKLETAAGGRS